MPYARTRLGRMFYIEHGASRHAGAPAVVLCHGYLFDNRQWDGQVGPLAKLGRVLVLDGPGHGKSEIPPRFSIEDHAEALTDLFRETGVDRVVMVGLSWGGMVAMRLALRHPAKVAALALLDTSAEAEPRRNVLKNRAFLSLHKHVGMPMGLFHRDVAPQMFGPDTLRDKKELVASAARNALGFSRLGVYQSGLAVVVHRTSVLDRIAQITAPTLVICGEDDAATVPEKSRNIAARIKGSRMVFIARSGHMTALEQPEAVNRELVPFVETALAGDARPGTHA